MDKSSSEIPHLVSPLQLRAQIIGHHKQRDQLTSLLTRARLPSSLLFVGANGIGKKLVALELAAKLLGLNQTFDHPDLILVQREPEERTIKIEAIRKLLHIVSIYPVAAKKRVIIINEPETITTQGLNALLKTLEEPSERNHFILVSSSPQQLLETIRSRCVQIRFNLLTNTEISEILTLLNHHKIPQDLLNGSLELLPILENNQELLSMISSNLAKIISECDLYTALKLARELSTHDDSGVIFKLLIAITRSSLIGSETSQIEIRSDLSQKKSTKTAQLLEDIILTAYLVEKRSISFRLALSALFTRAASTKDTALAMRELLPV